ncbi:MAG: hypothetical protein ACE5F6_14500 [Anaerolineae bacterium]
MTDSVQQGLLTAAAQGIGRETSPNPPFGKRATAARQIWFGKTYAD